MILISPVFLKKRRRKKWIETMLTTLAMTMMTTMMISFLLWLLQQQRLKPFKRMLKKSVFFLAFCVKIIFNCFILSSMKDYHELCVCVCLDELHFWIEWINFFHLWPKIIITDGLFPLLAILIVRVEYWRVIHWFFSFDYQRKIILAIKVKVLKWAHYNK